MTEGAQSGSGALDARPSFDLVDAESDEVSPFDRRGFQVALAASDPAAGGQPLALDPVRAELIAGAGAVVLLAALLFLPWFGTGVAVGRFASRLATPGSEGAWQTLTWLRWLVLLAVMVALLPVLIRPASRWLGLPKRMSAAITALGSTTALLLGFRVLIDLPDPSHVVDQQVGAIVGLLGALLIALGGLESTRADAAARARDAWAHPRRAGAAPGDLARIHA